MRVTRPRKGGGPPPEEDPPGGRGTSVPPAPALPGGRRDPAEAVTWPVRVAASWSGRLLIVAAAVYVLVRACASISLVIFAVIIALFLTAVLHPLERQIRRLTGGPSSLPPLLALLTGVVVLGAIGYLVAWQISSHAALLAGDVSTEITQAEHWLRNGPLHLKSADLSKITASLTQTIKSHQGQLASGAISTARTAAEALAGLLLVLLVTFYLLRDGQLIWAWAIRLSPRPAHARLDHAGRAGWATFGGYMRGQLLIALFHGVSVTIALLVLRVPLAAALGVLIFLGSFIPLIGLTITGALAVAVTLLEHGGVTALIVAAVIIVLIQAEAHLLQPFIMSRSVHVHPLAVILAVVAGTTLAGIAGALIAVPLAAFLNTTIQALRAPAQASRPPPPAAKTPPPAQLSRKDRPASTRQEKAAGRRSGPTKVPARRLVSPASLSTRTGNNRIRDE
jgi:predicted PurR-regulated permease PerM